MTNIQKMKSYLAKYVFPKLYEKGFTGKWPHFRRELGDCVELISFYTNKWGGAFSVYVSAIFPNSENKNYTIHKWMDITEDWLSAGDVNRDYRLKGMYDGEFHYRDLYSKLIFGLGMVYLHAPENKSESFVPPKGYKFVRKFDDEAALAVCEEVNKQFEKAYKWLDKFEKKHQKKYNKSKGGTQ